MKMDHVGVAVKSLDEASRTFTSLLGLTMKGVSLNPEEKVRVAFLEAGAASIELLESTSPDGVVARFIERRGEGIHHICFRVENLEDTLKVMMAKGAQLVDSKPMVSASGAKMAFVHPKSIHGVLLELIEESWGST